MSARGASISQASPLPIGRDRRASRGEDRWLRGQGVTISTGSFEVSRDAYSAWLEFPPEMRKVNVPLPVTADVTLISSQVPVVVVPISARRGAPLIGGALFQVIPLWVHELLTR